MKIYTGLSTFRTIFTLATAASLFLGSAANAQNACRDLVTEQAASHRVSAKDQLTKQTTSYRVSAKDLVTEQTASYSVSAKGKIKVSAEIGALFIDAGASQRNSTTGNRTEFKRTVSVENLKNALQKLGQTFVLKPRDAIKPGTKNVTITQYLNILKFDYNGQELGVKIRFRKYGTIKEGRPNTLENIEINPEMKDISFLEFKIDHPDFDNSVLKPRGVMADADIALIGTTQFLKNFETILSRALAQNSKNADSIETMTKMQNLLKKLHEEAVPLKLDSRTIYERTSYALPVKDLRSQKDYEIQITLDEGIQLYSYPHRKTIDAYKSDKPLTVVELKIPVEMVDKDTKGFKQDMLAAIPLLGSIQTFLNDLTQAQAPGYEANRGKQSLIRDLLEPKE